MASGVDWEAYLVSHLIFVSFYEDIPKFLFICICQPRTSMQSISVVNNDHRSCVSLMCAGLYLRIFKLLAVDKKFLLAGGI